MSEERADVSARGFYYNLAVSPYGYTSPYGDLYKLPSQKKLDMMERDAARALERVDKMLDKNDLWGFLPDEIIVLIKKAAIESVHMRLVG